MSTLQIRNVPESLSRELKARAARAGVSLSDFLLGELARSVERPSIDELRQRILRFESPSLPPAVDELAEARRAR